MSTATACESGNASPQNRLKIKLLMCCDSRKDDCPYHLPVTHKNKEHNIHFTADLCTFGYVSN